MEAITTVGLDIAKSVFQVHGVDADGNVILRRQLKGRPGLVQPEMPATRDGTPRPSNRSGQ
jgi:hypothetical protein